MIFKKSLLNTISLTAALSVFCSCADHPSPAVMKPSSEKSEPVVNKGSERKSSSKPVKIPVGSVDRGKSSGMGMDDFFALQQSGNVLIYDVRAPYFYKIDHIPGSVNWPRSAFDDQVQRRDVEIEDAQAAGKKVVFYCFNLGCPEARIVAKKVSRRGYDVFVLTMGIDSWRNAGLPLE